MVGKKNLGGVTETSSPSQLLNVAQLAQRLNVNPSTVRRLIDSEKIPSIRVGSLYRFDWLEVVTVLKKK